MSRIVNARLGHGSMYGDNNSKPVSPDICLEYLWTENQNNLGYIFLHYFKQFVNICSYLLFTLNLLTQTSIGNIFFKALCVF